MFTHACILCMFINFTHNEMAALPTRVMKVRSENTHTPVQHFLKNLKNNMKPISGYSLLAYDANPEDGDQSMGIREESRRS